MAICQLSEQRLGDYGQISANDRAPWEIYPYWPNLLIAPGCKHAFFNAITLVLLT